MCNILLLEYRTHNILRLLNMIIYLFFSCVIVGMQRTKLSLKNPRRNVFQVYRQTGPHPLTGNLVPLIGVGVAFGQVLRQHGFFAAFFNTTS